MADRMDHIKILITLVNLIIGIIVAVHIFQVYQKYSYAYLRSLTGYIIFFNFLILNIILEKYFEINIGDDVFANYLLKPEDVNIILSIIIDVGLSYSILQLILRLFDKEIPKAVVQWLFPIFVLIILCYIIRLFMGEETLYSKVLYNLYNYFFDNLILIEAVGLLTIPFVLKQVKDKNKRAVVKSFTIIFLSRYLFFFIVLLLFPIRGYLAFILLLYVHLTPIFWLRLYVYPYANSMNQMLENSSGLKDFFDNYKLTAREHEIALLILDGKSNKEIEDELFISFHTVKNHISNIYRKCNIKTRHQLIHLLTTYSFQYK